MNEAENHEAPQLHVLDASRSSAMASMIKPEVKLKAILEITRNLSTELKIDAVAPKILDSLMELFPQAERLFLILVDPATKRLIRKAFKYRPTKKSLFSTTIPADEDPDEHQPLDRQPRPAPEEGRPEPGCRRRQEPADQRLDRRSQDPVGDVRSACDPRQEALGILQLDTSDRKQFAQEDLDVLAAVASQAAISIQNAQMHESLLERERLSRDLKLAEQVQKRFLPQSVPVIPGFEFFAHYDPAYEVGGDYYDFVPLPGDKLAIALGDVSGKGVSAALMMAKFSGDTRYCILTENSPSEAANELNSLLFSAGIEEKFITLSLCVLDTEHRTLSITSAGHLPLLIRRSNGTVDEIGEEIAGFPLGIVPEGDYRQIEVKLHPGDVVAVFSDGVTDARNLREEIYESRDKRRLLRKLADTSGGPETVGRAILQDIREFSAGHTQVDDITLDLLRAGGPRRCSAK